MSAKDPIRLSDMHSGAPELDALGQGVRELRALRGDAAQIDALAARLGPELASNALAGTALLSSALLRFALIGVSVMGLGLGGWLYWGPSSVEVAAVPRAPIALPPQRALPVSELGAAAGPAPETPVVEAIAAPPPSAKVQRATVARPHPEKASVKGASVDPEAELVLLGRAQALLDRDPNGALTVLGEHARSHARGVFSEEREVLALEAESKLGHKALARARAERFIAHYPRSAHARRVRTLLEPAP